MIQVLSKNSYTTVITCLGKYFKWEANENEFPNMGNEALRGIIKQTPEWGGIPMKKWIWAVLIFLVAGVVGGYSVAHYHENELQYQRNITNGQTAIAQKNYAAAKNYFSRALTKKKNDREATNLLDQTRQFTRAESEFKSNEFTSARLDYQNVLKISDGSRTLKERSQARVKLIKKIRANFKKFSKQLKKAKKLNAAWDFYASNAQLDLLLSNEEFNKGYYETLHDQALTLQRFNNAGIVADQGAFNSDTTPDNNQGAANKSLKPKVKPRYEGPTTTKPAAPKKKPKDSSSKDDSKDKPSNKESSDKPDSDDSTNSSSETSSSGSSKPSQTEKEAENAMVEGSSASSQK